VITKKIVAVLNGGVWSVAVEFRGSKKNYTGIVLRRILEQVEDDLRWGDNQPDLHDLTGETRHIGVEIPKEWVTYDD
tara:strand:- start:930 stop:1160 length:231 start_codon:yes stop_codon:yes gene_type:complete